MDQLIHLPWYMKTFLALGGAAMLWKAVQGNVPRVVDKLIPRVEHLVDLLVGLILGYPLLRWFILGNKDNFKATFNALVDGFQRLIDAAQNRFNADIDKASAEPPPAPPPPPAATPAAPVDGGDQKGS